MVVLGQSCCIRAKVVVFGQKWLYSGEKGSIRAKNCCYRAKVVVFGRSGCIRAKVVVFGQKLFYTGRSGSIRVKVVDFGQISCIRAKMLVIGQKVLYGSIRGKEVLFGQKMVLFLQTFLFRGKRCCTWTNLLYSGKSGCIREKVVVI